MEEEKHRQTLRELLARYGGCRMTAGAHPAYEGLWQHSGQTHRDLVKSLIVETPVRASDFIWLSDYKQQLEQRFQQIEVYIAVREIKRII